MSATDGSEDLVEVTPEMTAAGVQALLEESYATPHGELVDLIYSAMEYQRRRACASATISRR
jgi:hypothetical protein